MRNVNNCLYKKQQIEFYIHFFQRIFQLYDYAHCTVQDISSLTMDRSYRWKFLNFQLVKLDTLLTFYPCTTATIILTKQKPQECRQFKHFTAGFDDNRKEHSSQTTAASVFLLHLTSYKAFVYETFNYTVMCIYSAFIVPKLTK